MDPFTVAIALLLVGAVFLIAEAASPGAFMVIPGAILIILGIVGAVCPDILFTWWSVAVAVAITVPVTLATLKLYQKLGSPEPPATTVADSLSGKTGTVTVAVEPGNLKGKVRIGNDMWSATSDEPIEEGSTVMVERGEGVHVRVRRLRRRHRK